jgi:hypothetical protein
VSSVISPPVISLLVLISVAAGCARPPAPVKRGILWQPIGSWSGHGNLQTESFVSNTGYLRVTWETTQETAPNAGRFKLTVGSSISGRTLQNVVDFKGIGHNTAYVNEDPRTFYALVESSNVEWTFKIDEGIPATVQDKP